MRTFSMTLEVPDDYNYADEILYMMASEYGKEAGIKVRIAEDSRAVVASSIARGDAAGLVQVYRHLRDSYEGHPFARLYDAYCLLAASYDEMLAERYVDNMAKVSK